jgi:GT2 family glycosyltransferase
LSKPISLQFTLPHFALCDTHQRNDALLAHALTAMKAGRDADALIAVESVCRHYPDKAMPALLRARIVEASLPELAAKAWYLAWACEPENPMLQDALLSSWIRLRANQRVIELGRLFLPKRCQDGTHAALLALLQQAGMRRVGACWISASGLLTGQFFHLTDAAPNTVMVRVSDSDADFFGQIQVGSAPFAFPRPVVGQVYSLAFDDDAGELFQGSPLIFAAPPAEKADQANQEEIANAVDIVVPVYRGFLQVQACLNSVLESFSHNKTNARLIVVDDASPEPALQAWLDELAQQKRCVLIRNQYNLGFVEATNRGLRHHPKHDVVLLNADTLVHGGWIDRLRRSLYAATDIAAVTPWSNNGEISSFPKIVNAAPMPDLTELGELNEAAVASSESISDVELPVCCGFTMMIKRQALNQVGLLDGAGFHRGYGEEVDWCLRARAAGYRHRLATSVFVAHSGGVSFGMEKILRVRQNRAVLMARYPDYYPEYGQFVRNDGLATARKALRQNLQGCAWLSRAITATLAGSAVDHPLPVFLPPPLSGAVRRVAVWHVPPESPATLKVLRLARAIASQPQLGLRLLVFGPITEALWHTGVVDGLPDQSSHKSLFSDQSILGLSDCVALLAESEQGNFDVLPYYQINQAFDPIAWLAQFEYAQQQGLMSVL